MFDKPINLIAFLCKLNLIKLILNIISMKIDLILSILIKCTFFLELNKMICFKTYMYVLIVSERQKNLIFIS